MNEETEGQRGKKNEKKVGTYNCYWYWEWLAFTGKQMA